MLNAAGATSSAAEATSFGAETTPPAADKKTSAIAAVGADKPAAAPQTNNAIAAPSLSATNAASTAQSSGAASSQNASGSDVANSARFVQRVANAIQSLGDGSDSLRLRLSPPELGSLRLQITMRNGTMNAHIEAETPAAKNMLLDNLPALRDRLAQQNIRVDRFDVDLMDRSGGGAAGQTADQFGANQQQQRGVSPTPVQTVSQAVAAPTAASTVTLEGNRLNVIV
jgi:flagellar hook-length control protein FliK